MPFESMLAISAVLLIVSGGFKLFDPNPTRGALRAAGLPADRGSVVVLALVEIVVGVAALVVPGPLAPLAVAVAYLGFAGFVAYALRNELPIQSCGCFGRSDTPPSALHLVLNLTMAAGALGAAFAGAPMLDRLFAAPVAGTIELAFAAIGAYLVYLILAELPATLAAIRSGG